VHQTQGALELAVTSYTRARILAWKLAAARPSQVSWQNLLSLCFENIGRVQQERGELDSASENHEEAHRIREKLKQRRPKP
jgi:hypothetical protein